MHVTRTRPAVEVSADGVGVVSHAGSRLLADLADRTGLTATRSAVFAGRTVAQTAHDPGRVLTDVAVMIAGGGECISDIAALADQPGVFGPVASDSTCWRVLDAIVDPIWPRWRRLARPRGRWCGRSGPRRPAGAAAVTGLG